ncbi:MAG: hypothetical protein WB615_15585 [Candidatus Tumulicola sp.]
MTKPAFMLSALGVSLTLAMSAGASSAPAPERSLPRIGVRSGTPYAEFYNVATGARFSPGGFNYTILDRVANRKTFPYRPTYAHVTFDSGFYDPASIDAVLASMHDHGFNVIRVILDSGDAVHQDRGQYGIAGPFESLGLYKPFVDNLVDFLRRARRHAMYVIVALHAYPENRGFRTMVQSGTLPHVTGTNQYYFSPGGIRAKTAYVTDLVRDVASVDGGSLLTTVLAWEVQVEIFVSDIWEPFSLHSGTVVTADGRSYDMSDAASRQACMDANLVNWATAVSAAIRAQDPHALVTAGSATYDAVHKPGGPNGLIGTPGSDPRYPPRLLAFARSRALSFIDVHAYPRNYSGYTLEHDLDSNEFGSWDRRAMPVLIGEFGANQRQFPTVESAIAAIRRQQQEALRLGIAGTVYWTWNTLPDRDKWWSAVEDDGAVLKALLRP